MGLTAAEQVRTVQVVEGCTFRSCGSPAGPLLQTSKVVLRAVGCSKSSTHRAATSSRDTWPCSTGTASSEAKPNDFHHCQAQAGAAAYENRSSL